MGDCMWTADQMRADKCSGEAFTAEDRWLGSFGVLTGVFQRRRAYRS